MKKFDDKKKVLRAKTGKSRANKKLTKPATKPPATSVLEIYEVIIECRHEPEQRAVYERMCGEGFRCRVMTL
jgi:hypothetical protein